MTTPVLRALAAAVFLSFPAWAGSVVIEVKCQTAQPCLIDGAVVLRSVADSSVLRRAMIDGSRTAPIAEMPPGSEWDVSLEAGGVWALPQRVKFPVEDVERRETIAVWRTGRLRARIKASAPLPEDLRVIVASAPDRKATSAIPPGTAFACTSDSRGQWTCSVPATLLDVSLHASGFAPHYQWDVKVPAAGTVELGTIMLKKGASFVAWLDAGTLREVKGPVRAILRRHVTGDPSPNAARLEQPVAEGVFTSKGMVQLAPLAAGRYLLETQADGFAPARVPVEVAEGRESVLRGAIELARAVTARLRFEPAVAPDGTPWQVDVWRHVGHGAGWERGTSGSALQDGTYVAREQAAGPAKLVLRDGRRNVLASRELVLLPGDQEHLVTIDVSAITGRVTIGDETLPGAALVFGGSSGAEKVRATASESGTFNVVLPRRGRWMVEVDAPEANVSAVAELDVPENSNEVDIELPSTEVSGWVIGPDGARLASAEVALMLTRSLRKQMTDADGNFRFRGVAPGKLRFQATDLRTREYSPIAEVTAPEEGVTQNVALAIESLRQVKGIVRSNGIAVAGARVNGYAFVAGAAQQERATTDISGAFTLDAPESAAQMILVVGAPGRPLQAFTVPVRQEPAVLELAARGGSLHLQWPPEARPLRVLFNDIMLPVTDLLDWARSQGELFRDGSVQVPNVSAGKYQLCTPDRCVDGMLSMGGRLELNLTNPMRSSSAGMEER